MINPSLAYGLSTNYLSKNRQVNRSGVDTDTINHNLMMLWNRKQGERLIVKDGSLERMSPWQRLKYACSSNNRTEVGEKINEVIVDITEAVNGEDLEQTKFFQRAGRPKEATFGEEFYFEVLARLSPTVYKRQLSQQVFDHLHGRVEEKVREEGESAGRFRDLATHSETIAQRAEVVVWAKLGNISRNGHGGCSGSYLVKAGRVESEGQVAENSPSENRGFVPAKEGAILAIFKPGGEETNAASNPHWRVFIQKIFKRSVLRLFEGSCGSMTSGQACVTEEVASVIWNQMVDIMQQLVKRGGLDQEVKNKLEGVLRDNPNMVPDTWVTTMRTDFHQTPEMGSFQAWAKPKAGLKIKEYSGLLGVDKSYRKAIGGSAVAEDAAQLPQELFELMVVLHYLMGQTDGHGENILAAYKDDGASKKVEQVVFIDNGRAMPRNESPGLGRHSLAPAQTAHQYDWGILPQAQSCFSEFGQAVVQELVENRDGLQGSVQSIYDRYLPFAKSETKGRIVNMSRRLKVLQEAATLSGDRNQLSFKKLSRLRTEPAIKNFLKSSSPSGSVN